MSLVEVMVVIAIVLVLMVVVGFGAVQVGRGAKVDITWLAMGQAAQHVDAYAFKNGTPSTDEGLIAVYGDAGRVPTDGWGSTLGYEAPGPKAHAFDLVSLGEDGEQGGESFAKDLRWSEQR